jgi:hypothetical protein
MQTLPQDIRSVRDARESDSFRRGLVRAFDEIGSGEDIPLSAFTKSVRRRREAKELEGRPEGPLTFWWDHSCFANEWRTSYVIPGEGVNLGKFYFGRRCGSIRARVETIIGERRELCHSISKS